MTTMLERTARAVIKAEQDQWDLPAAEWDLETLEVHGALSIARAVLMAVREPDTELQLSAWLFAPDDDYSDAQRLGDFTAMIDAMLYEGKE